MTRIPNGGCKNNDHITSTQQAHTTSTSTPQTRTHNTQQAHHKHEHTTSMSTPRAHHEHSTNTSTTQAHITNTTHTTSTAQAQHKHGTSRSRPRALLHREHVYLIVFIAFIHFFCLESYNIDPLFISEPLPIQTIFNLLTKNKVHLNRSGTTHRTRS